MLDLPAGWAALCALSFVLGARHGLDADHLAVIDGLTRVSARRGQPHASGSGALFALGHGSVVLVIAVAAGAAGAKWVTPAWFEVLGGGLSIGFLLLIGSLNLRAVLRAPAGATVNLVGVRSGLVERFGKPAHRASGPLATMAVGALFALSFDTLSQAALFAALAVPYGGVAHALALGLLFVLGMLVSDGANGWWVSRLIDRTDRLAVIASRAMTGAVACISLVVAALGAGRMASRWVDGWLDDRELLIGLTVIVLVASSYFAAQRAAIGHEPVATRP